MRPYYLIQEPLLRQNLELIKHVAEEADVEFILAFKAFALWRTFPIFRQYIRHTTASSLCEARLSLEEFGSLAHTYSPAYEDDEFPDILHCSGHVTFNSLSQYQRLRPISQHFSEHPVSYGLRVNPEYSEIESTIPAHLAVASACWQNNCQRHCPKASKASTAIAIAKAQPQHSSTHSSTSRQSSADGSPSSNGSTSAEDIS